ncbi:MAG: acyl-CoA/acyl-ACP dehydrogenase [Acidimicrobiia bacterium]|nr:acyl-CoA/acyl-ACP dehydrogenase [Acidimicrobiia bacterium]
MDFGLSEEQLELQALARRILSDRMTSARLKEIDASADWFDRDTWAELAKANLLGVALPEEHGGLGMGFTDLCLLLTEVGRSVAPLPVVTCLASAAMALAEFGSPDHRALLPSVVAGDMILTAALTEPGGDAYRPVTEATRSGDGWKISGVKTTVPAAHLSEAMLVPAVSDGATQVFVVDAGAPGLTRERQETIGREPQWRLTLDDVAVPDGAMLASDESSGEQMLGWIVARTTVALAAVASGVSAEALRLTAEYATQRHQFDRPIGSFQAVGQRLADAFIDNRAIELTMQAAATHLDEGREVPAEIATAKFWAADGGSRVVHAALHVHGGVSIDNDYPIHRYFLWMKQIESMLGAATPQLLRLGRILATEPV